MMHTTAASWCLVVVLVSFATLVAGYTPSALVQATTEFPCGGDYEGTEGIITSPNYPDNYPDTAYCEWTVTSPDKTVIVVNFVSFNTHNKDDYLEIRNGNNSNATLLVKLYGHLTSIDEVRSTGNSLFFYFHSEGSNTESGFMFNWLAWMTCYSCNNYPDTSIYDPGCGEDNYHGNTAAYRHSTTCYTNVHYDGSHHVERGYTDNTQEDGTCYDSGFSTTCYCRQSFCNNNLCQNCTTTPPPTTTMQPGTTASQPPITSTFSPGSTITQPAITTTQSPITSTLPPGSTPQPPTSNQPPTPAGSLQCYSCIDCSMVNEDTNVETSEEFLSCFVSLGIGNVHLVVRGGSPDFYNDGTCHEADGGILCYCTSNRCNSDAVDLLIK